LVEGCTVEHFRREVATGREPVLVRGLPLGPCVDLWTPEHLMQQGGNKEVSVHVSAHDRMDFITKNFQYQMLAFDELIARAAGVSAQPPAGDAGGGAHRPAEHVASLLPDANEARSTAAAASASGVAGTGGDGTRDAAAADSTASHEQRAGTAVLGAAPGGFFLQRDEKYYLRALGADPRKSIANLETDWPALAKEISTSSLCAEESFFSSVLRVGSPGIHLWTHYDVMDNALIQVSPCLSPTPPPLIPET